MHRDDLMYIVSRLFLFDSDSRCDFPLVTCRGMRDSVEFDKQEQEKAIIRQATRQDPPLRHSYQTLSATISQMAHHQAVCA